MGSVARHGGDDAGGHSHFPNGVIEEIGEVDVGGGVKSNCARSVQLGAGSRMVVASVATRTFSAVAKSIACHGRDNASGHIHFPDAVVAIVGNVEVSGGIRSNTLGKKQFGPDRWNIVSVVALQSLSA